MAPIAADVAPPSISHSWIEDASTTTTTSYGAIDANWTVPPNASNDSQTVYFFPGFEDNSDVVSILQPVLGWNADFSNAWGIASWNCCINGVTQESSPVQVNPGDTITGIVSSTCAPGTLSCPTWNITTKDTTTGKSAQLLNSPIDGQTFNWAFGGALEVYNVSKCGDYPWTGILNFSTIQLFDNSLNQISNPGWSPYIYTGLTPQCNYAVEVGPSQVTLDWSTPSNPTITSSLVITPGGPYYVNQTLQAQFTITNEGTDPATFQTLTAGGRLNGGCPAPIGCPDFTHTPTITLGAGQTFQYSGDLQVTEAGSYHFFTAYENPDGSWNTAIPTAPGVTNTVDLTVSAPTYTLTAIDSGQGTIASNDGQINCNYNFGPCSATYVSGTVVTLNETPATGWSFSGWGGACGGTGSCNVAMNGSQYVSATFIQNSVSYTLTVGESGQGTVTSNVGGINCVNSTGTCTAVLNSGSSVTLSANPATNWTFSGWTGASCSGTGPCTVVMNSNQSITANFSQIATSYTLTVVDSGQGNITSADTLINCTDNEGPCSHSYPSGSIVNLSATPAGGWTFSNWSGFCSGAGSCAVAMTANRTVTATFAPSNGGFTISGQVTYNGLGLAGVTVSLTGSATESTTTVASGNYSFTGLAAGGYNLSASLTGYTFDPGGWGISLYQNLTANFTAAKANYILSVSETGQGTVASLDGGISCTSGAGQCSASYAYGTNVTLNANPASGWQFYSWSGPCYGTGSCSITMNSSQVVTATFSQSSGPLVALPAFTPGIISTVAGNGVASFGGDGGPPTAAELHTPMGVAVDPRGIIYFADFDNLRVRAINTSSSPITVAGVTIEPGTIATVAGNGQTTFSGDGGPPTSAGLWAPSAVLLDSAGNLYISDTDLNRVRLVNMQSSVLQVFGVTVQPGTIQTIAGNGIEGYSGDGGPATSAELANPQGIAMDSNGNLYIADWANTRIRKVSATTGIISTVAGAGGSGSDGDGQLATNAHMTFPVAIALDAQGNIYFSETNILRVRVVYESGTVPGLSNPQIGYLYTIAGAGTGCVEQTDPAGDGCPSVDAGGIIGEGLAFDPGGSLYISDYENYRVRRIDHATGVITSVAGNGQGAYSGDGGSATNAELSFNSYWYGNILTSDSNGNIYFGDGSNDRVRLVSTVAAPVTFPPTNLGQTSAPQQVALQNDGNAALYITNFAVAGGNAGDFAQSNTCPVSPSPLAAGASCTINLTFTPTQAGSRSSSLVITDNAPTVTQSIILNGSTPVAPTTTTTGSMSVTPNSATLSGTVNPNGLDTQVWFRYGTDPALSNNVLTTPQQDQGAGTGPVTFNISVGNLTAGTPYYFQANASNSAGSSAGSILGFQTFPGTYNISGQITLNATGLSGVAVALTGDLTTSTTTDASGNYSFSGLAAGGNYTVTPSLKGYIFTPPNSSFSNLSANQTANFTAVKKKRKGQVISE
ncbi:MAG TPA: choice-of-anchor D domain-containing protein [Terriglobia bacterium]|nr:choice-of-anchor D domain-containing protein [Terriglobia bacterium]